MMPQFALCASIPKQENKRHVSVNIQWFSSIIAYFKICTHARRRHIDWQLKKTLWIIIWDMLDFATFAVMTPFSLITYNIAFIKSSLNLHMFVIFWCGVIWMTFFAIPTRKKVLLKFTAFQPLKHFFFLIIKKIKIEWKSIIVMNHSLILLLSLILYFTKCEMWYLPHIHMCISSFANGHNKLLFLMFFTPRREHHKD